MGGVDIKGPLETLELSALWWPHAGPLASVTNLQGMGEGRAAGTPASCCCRSSALWEGFDGESQKNKNKKDKAEEPLRLSARVDEDDTTGYYHCKDDSVTLTRGALTQSRGGGGGKQPGKRLRWWENVWFLQYIYFYIIKIKKAMHLN